MTLLLPCKDERSGLLGTRTVRTRRTGIWFCIIQCPICIGLPFIRYISHVFVISGAMKTVPSAEDGHCCSITIVGSQGILVDYSNYQVGVVTVRTGWMEWCMIGILCNLNITNGTRYCNQIQIATLKCSHRPSLVATLLSRRASNNLWQDSFDRKFHDINFIFYCYV